MKLPCSQKPIQTHRLPADQNVLDAFLVKTLQQAKYRIWVRHSSGLRDIAPLMRRAISTMRASSRRWNLACEPRVTPGNTVGIAARNIASNLRPRRSRHLNWLAG